MMLCTSILSRLVAEDAECKVGTGNGDEDEEDGEDLYRTSVSKIQLAELERATHHSFVGNRFDETIEDLGKRMRTDSRTTNVMRILIHALLPIIACIFQHGRTSSRITVVALVISCARSHLRKHFSNSDTRLFVHIAADSGPETVEDVHYAADEEHVEKQLGVEGEDVR